MIFKDFIYEIFKRFVYIDFMCLVFRFLFIVEILLICFYPMSSQGHIFFTL